MKQSENNAVILANCNEVVFSVISQIAGNDISNSVNGSPVTRSIIASLVNQRLLANAKKQMM